MRLVGIVQVSPGRFALIDTDAIATGVRAKIDVMQMGPPWMFLRFVTVESAREDYGVKVP